MNYRAAKQFIIKKLREELSDKLRYHGLHHTLDVLRMAGKIAGNEGITRREMVLLKTAALFHDCGFVKNEHKGHEIEGCQIARENLPAFGYTEDDIASICGMIMATRIPQSPANLLESILCDADLDYLGRDDFKKIGQTLFEEFTEYSILQDEQAWNKLQVSFLSSHRYHTETNRALREPVKRRYLEELKALVATY